MSQWQSFSDDLSAGHIHILELYFLTFSWLYRGLCTLGGPSTVMPHSHLPSEMKMHGTPVCYRPMVEKHVL